MFLLLGVTVPKTLEQSLGPNAEHRDRGGRGGYLAGQFINVRANTHETR